MAAPLKELAVGGVWAASAIGVAGWTWQAYTQQYSKFPMPGDAPTSTSASDVQNWVDLATNPIKWLADKVAGQLQKPVSKALGAAFGAPKPKVLKESPAGIAQARARGVHPGPGR